MKEKYLTTNQGVPITDNQNSMSVGERGPVLLQDVQFIEKIAHFDRERIPERVVHAKGAGTHGYFQVYKNMAPYTKAKFLQDPDEKHREIVPNQVVVAFFSIELNGKASGIPHCISGTPSSRDS
ncbi:hypothetical protein ES703_95147 [subsurface metagenome]